MYKNIGNGQRFEAAFGCAASHFKGASANVVNIMINKIITYKIASATVRAVGVAEAAREMTDWCFAGESSCVIYLD